MSVSRTTTHVISVLLGLILLAAPGWGAGSGTARCSGLPVLSAGDALRGDLAAPGSSDRLLLEVAEPGVVALAAAVPADAPLPPELALAPAGCGAATAGAPALVVERTASSLLALIRTPGRYRLRVMSRDPLLAVGAYRLDSRFARLTGDAEPSPGSVFAADGEGGTEEEEEDIEEVEGTPINLRVPGAGSAAGDLLSVFAADGEGGTEEEEEDIEEVEGTPINLRVPGAGSAAGDLLSVFAADGEGGTEEEEEDIEEVEGTPINLRVPVPGVLAITAGPSGSSLWLGAVSAGRVALRLPVGVAPAALRLLPLCASAGGDDHGDLPLCATALAAGATAAGSLGNAFGDDYDLFTFRLASAARVRIETTGGTDTVGGLYDAGGRRLAVDDDGGYGGNFRLDARLEPGRYSVRVEGAQGAEGDYRLRVRELAD